MVVKHDIYEGQICMDKKQTYLDSVAQKRKISAKYLDDIRSITKFGEFLIFLGR